MEWSKTKLNLYELLTVFIATIWLVNGLFCKVLNFVPRHEEIVSAILGSSHSRTLTLLIGISEIVMAFWILSHFQSRWNARLQMSIILIMNILEATLAPQLLLWGKLNAIFALLFIGLIYYNEFILKRKFNSNFTQ